MYNNKNNYLIFVFITVLLFQFISIPVKAENKENSQITLEAKSALLMEPETGTILYEKNSHEKLAPASVTKIMTMLLTMEAIDQGKISLDDKVTVSENAKKMGGSSMLLDTGEIKTVEQLLKGIAVASGNDASVAMAEYLSGSEDAFVNKMNKRAKELKMNDTNFENCTGLSAPDHMSSAYDIAIMSRELLKHKEILKYTGTYMETISEGRKDPIELVNHNKLVRFFKGCDGLKTGFTDEAKYCISATASRDGVRMLSIIMGSETYKIRNKEASMLLNYGFSKYERKKVIKKDEELENVQLGKQKDRFFIAKSCDDLNLVVEKGSEDNIEKKITIDKKRKQYSKGEKVGFCEVYINGKPYGKVEVYCDREVKKPGLWYNIKLNTKDLFDSSI